jgi:sortase A
MTAVLEESLSNSRPAGDPGGAAPLALPDEQGRRLRARRAVALGLLLLAGLIVGFIAYEFFLSSLVEQRSQQILLDRFRFLANEGLATTPEWQPAPGDPIAVLTISQLGIESVVVEGTSSSATTSGPGHLRQSPLPGRPGNSVIAARRTTFGAPFRDLDLLQEGQLIQMATGVGVFTYRIRELREVRPGETDVLDPTGENLLTLITSAPEYRASGRLAVIAELDGDPAAQELGPIAVIPADETGLTGQPWALAPLLLLVQALIGTLLAAVWFARQMSQRVAWLLAAPVTAALLWAIFGCVNRLLPATL